MREQRKKNLHVLPNEAFAQLRVTHRKANGKKVPKLLIRCGDCDERVEIEYDDEFLNINGVLGSLASWREILLPLLENESRGEKLLRHLRKKYNS